MLLITENNENEEQNAGKQRVAFENTDSGASKQLVCQCCGMPMEDEIVEGRCFGVLANMDFIMICTYEAEGANQELILYKKR